jgi:hypothetical protein
VPLARLVRRRLPQRGAPTYTSGKSGKTRRGGHTSYVPRALALLGLLLAVWMLSSERAGYTLLAPYAASQQRIAAQLGSELAADDDEHAAEVAQQERRRREVCVNRTQALVNRTQALVNRTLALVNRTQEEAQQRRGAMEGVLDMAVCVNRTQALVNRTQALVNRTLALVNRTQEEAQQRRGAMEGVLDMAAGDEAEQTEADTEEAPPRRSKEEVLRWEKSRIVTCEGFRVDIGWSSLRGRFATSADLHQHGGTPYRGLRVRREMLGIVPHSPCRTLTSRSRNFCIADGGRGGGGAAEEEQRRGGGGGAG